MSHSLASQVQGGAKQTIEFEDRTVRQFMIAAIFWGIVSMLVGVIAASQLRWWQMNGQFLETLTFGLFKGDGLQYITFGRLRPLHTNAAIFAFVGNMMFAGIYYSTQRLCQCRTASDLLSKIHFWGWQLIIVAAAITLPAGMTRGKEYAELIWPINIAVAVIWVIFAINFFWTLKKRNEPSLYVALWFYIATIVTVAMLYIVNHLSIPTSWTHSYPIFGGVQDALVQWWYGHNAVAFFLTTPILGIMYYFLPKAANRPVYSYRLSIVHFWSLVFIYIWAGPHHLLNTSLPKWLQLLGMFFSLMLWAPSWGGMLNGLLTLRGAWDKLRTDPVIKFFAAGVTFYGMATFEGPLLSIRAVNSLSHYSDWTIGHVHSGTLGWNGFMAAGMFYWMAPRLWKTKLWSTNLANMHFWIGLVGILLYVASMWISGVSQGLMLNAVDETGTLVKYGFMETVQALSVKHMMTVRVIGGLLYLVGFFLLVINIWKTVRGAEPVVETREVYVAAQEKDGMRWAEVFRNDPITYSFWGLVFAMMWIFLPPAAGTVALVCTLGLGFLAVKAFMASPHGWSHWYDRLLVNYLPFTVLTFIAVAIGGAIQIIPTITVNKAANVEDRVQKLYTPLELAGRDIYVSEGCYNCHSQMVRTMVPDVLRYGEYSRLGESIYDHPFQWGSKRTGPDLAHKGVDSAPDWRNNEWHYTHLLNPRMNPGSPMPAYPWLAAEATDFKALPGKIKVQRILGVPYAAMNKHEIEQGAREQAMSITKDLVESQVSIPALEEAWKKEAKEFEAANPDEKFPPPTPEEMVAYLADKKIIALIAYLQKLGQYDEVAPAEEGQPLPPSIKPGIPDDFRKFTSTKTETDPQGAE